MGIKPKYFLKNQHEKQVILGHRLIDIFLISDEINLVDSCLCENLSVIVDSNVYWYLKGKKAAVCVLEGYAHEAITIGKKIIIQHFASMSSEYIENNLISPVLDQYSIIATFKTCSAIELTNLCSKIDDSLLVKINSDGDKCVLTNKPAEILPKVESEKIKLCKTFLNI